MTIKIVSSSAIGITAASTKITNSSLNSTGKTTGSGGPATIKYVGFGLAPGIGSITKGGTPVSPSVGFTQADINSGLIAYTGDPKNTTIAVVYLTYTVVDTADGTQTSGRLELDYPIPDKSPEGTVTTLYVPRVVNKPVAKGNINFTDLKDSAIAIFFVLQAWPAHGDIFFKGTKIAPGATSAGKPYSFTQDDINKGYISYTSFENDPANEDSLVFKVRDSHNNWSGLKPGEIYSEADANVYTLPIVIADQPLTLVKSGPMRVDKCATIVIDNTNLFARDLDDPTLVITFTLLPETVAHGVLKKGTTTLGPGSTFTQGDIDAGLISYTQDCSDEPIDEFHFDVAHSKETLADNTFTINLIPNLKPKVSIAPLNVTRCKTQVVTTEISIEDPEKAPDDKIILVMTALPAHGKMLLNGADLAVGQEFTYADILAGNLSYQHDCTPDPKEDEFDFTVSDGANTDPYVMPIKIGFSDKPPYMTQNAVEDCERQGEVTWDVTKFNFADDDTDPTLVTLTFTALPQYGQMTIDGVPIDTTTVYKLSDWATHQFRYATTPPDPVASSVVTDFAEFKLNDVNNEVDKLQLNIRFPPPPVDCPHVAQQITKSAYGATKALSEADISVKDDGVDPKDLVFTYVKATANGTLNLNGTPLVPNDTAKGVFTYQDLLDMKVSYVYTFTGTTPPAGDTFDFTLTNGFCQIADTHNISFLPGLRIDINKVLDNVQGATDTIDNLHLASSSGNVTDNSMIVYKMTSLTVVGKVSVNGVEATAGQTFTQADIDGGLVTYTSDPDQVGTEKDQFDFSVTDGLETLNDTFHIKIGLIDRPPVIVINPLVVGELTCHQISTEQISISDNESSDAQLLINLKSYPIWGKLYLYSVEIPSSAVSSATKSFTYDDIIKGGLSYCETEPGVLLDSFDFIVTDSGGNVSDLLTQPIQITPPPPPILVNKGLVTTSCTRSAITPVTLGLQNLKTTADKSTYVFKVNTTPTKGILALNGITLIVGQTFTYTDIIANSVTYTGTTWHTDEDSFTFDLNGPDITELNQTFTIKFRITDNPPWVCENNTMIIVMFETRTLTLDLLQMCDVDLDYDNVEVNSGSNQDDSPGVAGDTNFPIGPVISPADADASERAYSTIQIESPGTPYTLDFTVGAGSAKIVVKDSTLRILASSACQTAAAGLQQLAFTPSASSSTITIQVDGSCQTGPRPSSWTVNLQKAI